MADGVEVTTPAADGTAAQPTISEATRAEINRLVERVSVSLSGFSEFNLEVFKARQSFYERLMLLDAGTLTLLFTVIGALASASHNTQVHIRDGYHLINGCWLLIASIVLCLIHNWVNIRMMIESYLARICQQLGIDVARLERAVRTLSSSVVLQSLQTMKTQVEKSQKIAQGSEKISHYIGLSAQILTICAFIQFILSFRATVMTLLN